MTTQSVPAKTRRTTSGTVLQVSDLYVTFPSEAGPVRAVRGLSFELDAGETLAVVGESGSGKSVTSLAVMGLLPATAKITGSVKLHGDELLNRNDEGMSRLRGESLAMVFQDPLSALTPVYTIGDQIVEAIQVHHDISRAAAMSRAMHLLDLVGIPNPTDRVRSFPHEFSGGMRQRIQVDIVDVPVDEFSTTLSKGEFELIAFSWIGTPYPFLGTSQIYGSKSESNYAQLSMPEVDKNADLLSTEIDKAARIKLANDTSAIIWENVHTLPLYQRPQNWASKANLANYGSFGLGQSEWEIVGFQK